MVEANAKEGALASHGKRRIMLTSKVPLCRPRTTVVSCKAIHHTGDDVFNAAAEPTLLSPWLRLSLTALCSAPVVAIANDEEEIEEVGCCCSC